MSCGCEQASAGAAALGLGERMAASPLLARGGFAVSPWLYGQAGIQALLREAMECYPRATASDTAHSDREEWRGGNPARRFLSCGAGPVQDHFYHAPEILHFLRELTHLDVRCTGNRGTFTYYVRPGDFLEVHRDIRTCDLAVVTCLMDTAQPGDSGGLMDFYPRRTHEELSRIRASLNDGCVSMRLQPGETIIMLGGVVPHAIRPVSTAQQRVVSVLCYEAS